MRKYHQLLLFLVSCFSVTVLLFYRSENSRLKDVLNAVNFFSRKDVADLRQIANLPSTSETYEFTRPVPVWQVVGENFHAYSVYWHRNELKTGGEAVALVVGKTAAVINFLCRGYFGSHFVQGKFHFQHMTVNPVGSRAEARDFSSYYFFCNLKSGNEQPDSIVFTDLTSSNKWEYKLRLRYISRKDASATVSSKQLATICVDLVSFNMSAHFAQDEMNLLQFFYHHYVLGVEHFIIYNGDELPVSVLEKLRLQTGIQLHMLPFNFPFSSANRAEHLRTIIEGDCLLRNLKLARHTLLLSPDEFFLPNAKLTDEHCVLRSMQHYAAEVTQFELPAYSVCIDRSNQLLANNSLYDPELQPPHRIYVYRPHAPTSAASSPSSSAAFSLTQALVHKYTTCVHVGSDGLHNWRSALRQDFMKNIQEILNEVNALIRK